MKHDAPRDSDAPASTKDRATRWLAARLAVPAEVQRDAIQIGPKTHVARDGFAAIIGSDGLRITDRGTQPVQGLDDIVDTVSEPRADARRRM